MKPAFDIDSEYFRDIMSRYKIIGIELIDMLIQGVNFKEKGGAKKETRRNEVNNQTFNS